MTLRRLHRLWLASGLVAALLFMQIAASAYACTRTGSMGESPAAADGAAATVSMADMPGCDGHMAQDADMPQPHLCKVHCDQGTQTVSGTPGAADVPPPALMWAVLDTARIALQPLQTASARPCLRSGAPPPGAPPIYLSLLVLRN